MKQARRNFLATSVAGGAALAALGLLRPIGAYATPFNSAAAGARNLKDAFKSFGADQMNESRDIVIKAPNIAENGTVVPVEVSSKVAGTSNIAILIEKNTNPFTASFAIPSGTEAYVSTRVKMSATSPVHVVVKAGDKFYHAEQEVKVTIGGCGGATPAPENQSEKKEKKNG